MNPPHDPAAAARNQLAAYNRGDIEAFVACYTPDVEVFRLPGQTPILSGRDAMRASYAKLFSSAPELNAVVTARLVQGDFVIDHESLTGHPRGVTRAVAIYEVEGDLIRRVWFAG